LQKASHHKPTGDREVQEANFAAAVCLLAQTFQNTISGGM